MVSGQIARLLEKDIVIEEGQHALETGRLTEILVAGTNQWDRINALYLSKDGKIVTFEHDNGVRGVVGREHVIAVRFQWFEPKRTAEPSE